MNLTLFKKKLINDLQRNTKFIIREENFGVNSYNYVIITRIQTNDFIIITVVS